jgi:uncharacterized membrane protein HdeD (DUF308 family)
MSTEAIELDPASASELKERWWVFLLVGIVTAGAGILVLVRPWTGVFALAVLIAVGLLVSGIGDLVGANRWPNKWVPIVWGLLSIAAGVVAVVWPSITLWALAVVIGVGITARGLVRVVGALTMRPYLWGLWVLFGVVEVVVGILAIAWPNVTILVLAVVIGIDLLIAGVVEIVAALRFRTLT